MADDVDRAGPVIQNVVDDGIARVRRALDSSRLTPIVQDLDGMRFGVCHYCESPIRPGNLFYEKYKEDPPHSCSAEWERERQRMKDSGL